MEFENIEQVIVAMQSSQFSMEEKKEILVEFFKSLSQNESANNTSNKNSTFKSN